MFFAYSVDFAFSARVSSTECACVCVRVCMFDLVSCAISTSEHTKLVAIDGLVKWRVHAYALITNYWIRCLGGGVARQIERKSELAKLRLMCVFTLNRCQQLYSHAAA